MTVIAFIAVGLTGCGGVVGSCAKVAVSAGSKSAAGAGAGAGKTAVILGTDAAEQAGRAGAHAGRTAVEGQASGGASSQGARTVKAKGAASEESRESALGRIGKEALQQGADKGLDALGRGSDDRDRQRREDVRRR